MACTAFALRAAIFAAVDGGRGVEAAISTDRALAVAGLAGLLADALGRGLLEFGDAPAAAGLTRGEAIRCRLELGDATCLHSSLLRWLFFTGDEVGFFSRALGIG